MTSYPGADFMNSKFWLKVTNWYHVIKPKSGNKIEIRSTIIAGTTLPIDSWLGSERGFVFDLFSDHSQPKQLDKG
jgi:hypothetical protein